MAIPVDYFQPESFQQANPFMTGFAGGQGLIQQALNNQILNTKAQYAQPMAQQDLLKAQLNNQIMQPQAQYAPEMTLADLALKRAMPGYYNAMANETMSRIPLNEAQANLANAQVPYVPYQALGKFYGGIGSFLNHSPSALVTKFQNTPAFQNLVSTDPTASSNYAATMNAALNNQVVLPGLPGTPPMVLNGSQTPPSQSVNPQASSLAPGYSPMAFQQPINAPTQNPVGQQQRGVPPSSMINTPYGPVSQMNANAVGNATANAYLKTAYTPQQLQQITYENSAENMLKQITPDLPAITNFAGLAGKARMTVDKYASSMGLTNNPDYQKWVSFSQTRAPIIANEIRRALGGQATDSEREIMDDLVNPVYWNKNPQLAVSQFNALFDSLRANSQAITQPKNTNLSQAVNSISNPMSATLNQSSNGRVHVMSPDGKTIGTISSKNLNNALASGYKQVQ